MNIFMQKLPSSNRQGSYSILLLMVSVFVVLAVAAGWYFLWDSGGDKGPTPQTATVQRGVFVAQVLDQGEIQSAENVEIRCQVGSRNGDVEVIEVVPEATMVEEGDFLVLLDATPFEKELEQQQIAVTNAKTKVISSKTNLDAAIEAKKEYLQGIFVERERTILNEQFDAQQELDQARANLEHNLRLHGRGFINDTQLRAFEIAVQRAENSLELANQKLQVLREITKPKEVIVFDGDINAAEITYQNDLETLRIEEEKLAEIKEQIENCRIVVPPGVKGEVVYNKEFDRRGGSDWVLEPGAQVRERQVLIKIPDRDKMEVKALINEQSITLVKTGMPARIKVDALNNQTLKGVVTYINRTAESSGWMSSAVREYAAFVRIIDPPETLIPGMNASVSIQSKYQEDVLTVPIQCIYASGEHLYVLRQTDQGGWETVKVEVGGDNSQVTWVKSGVEEGDVLAMMPGAYPSLLDLPESIVESPIDLSSEKVDSLTETDSRNLADPALAGEPGGPNGPNGPNRSGGPGGPGQAAGRGQAGMGGSGGAPNISDMMARMDPNGDGVIDADELDQLDSRFADRVRDADQDGDGQVTEQEFSDAMRAMMRRFQQGGGPGGGRPGGGRPGGGAGRSPGGGGE